MPAFDYFEPSTLDEAFGLLALYGEDAHILAGGTALVLLMRLGLVLPSHVIGLRRIEGLRGIGRTGGQTAGDGGGKERFRHFCFAVR